LYRIHRGVDTYLTYGLKRVTARTRIDSVGKHFERYYTARAVQRLLLRGVIGLLKKIKHGNFPIAANAPVRVVGMGERVVMSFWRQ